MSNEAVRPQILKIINKRDHLENTALHYATQMWPQSVVRQLLEAGANIGMKNHWHETPVSKILPSTLEAYLDEVTLIANYHIPFYQYSYISGVLAI